MTIRWRALGLLGLLAGCASQPEPLPPATIVTPPVVCEVPAGLTAGDDEPARPQGEYTQRDVAEYVVELHRWGASGWARVEAIEAWSEGCVRRERLRTGQQAGPERD
ncbi:MAG: hypothetical protein JJU06_12535 [Ectothiorhodospiraceae bacterium]|nr:hypothetical protein [Ectothiorhodospiraceae bacterium]